MRDTATFAGHCYFRWGACRRAIRDQALLSITKAATLLIMIRLRLFLFVALAFLFATAGNAALKKGSRPNIVLIMVDDLGFADLGCYGSEIETPHLDKMAAEGLRFSRFYNTAKCHSSRVSLLTGLYCDQAGAESLSRGVTIAEVLKSSGYKTSMVGKWHLHREPTDRGFKRYFGHLSGATNFFTGDNTFRLNGEVFTDFPEGFYCTDAFVDYSKRFVQAMLDENDTEGTEDPFFLYLAFNAPHYPLHVREEEFRKYDGRYADGWDAVRAKRYEKQLELGVVDPDWQLSKRPDLVPEWSSMTTEQQDIDQRKMAAFAGMVDRVDQKIGELRAFLEEKGEWDNTLLLFCSDNGACPFDRTENLHLDPWDPESYWCYDTGWSHVGNTPFRLHKQNQHFGGIASPMIVVAGKDVKLGVPAGHIDDTPTHLIDVMATAIDLAGAEYPRDYRGLIEELEPLEGLSWLPVLTGQGEIANRDYLYFQFGQNRALIQHPWKIVTHRLGAWELYQIDDDGTEMNDLAKQHPERVKKMAALWHELAERKNRLKPNLRRPVSDGPAPNLLKDGRPNFERNR